MPRLLPLLLLLLLALTGCGPTDSRLCEVEGTLRFNGKPMPGVQISFEPDDKSKKTTAMAMTDASGKFVMQIGNTPGVFKGKSRIVCDDPLAAMGTKTQVPAEVEPEYRALTAKYGFAKSTHEITIEKTNKKFDLNLD